MKIGIYLTTGEGVGGADYSVAVLAEALARAHDVEIVHHKRALTADTLASFTGTNLGAVRLRYLAEQYTHGNYGGPRGFGVVTTAYALRHYWRMRRAASELSRPYDLLIYCSVNLPLPCSAPRGILIVFFPWEAVTPYVIDQLWKEHLAGYQDLVTNSIYSQSWTRRRWGADSHVIAPPVDTDFGSAAKATRIITTGRFVGRGRSKRQLELMDAFGEISAHLPEWSYTSAGGLSDRPEDRAYFDALRRKGEDAGATVVANLDRGTLKRLYEEAAIFWYAAGYGEDATRHPEMMEHFGIVTAEAMAAGCVPVVFNDGGQPEIVRHEVDGFLWNTLDELKDYTLRLSRDAQLRERMSASARHRARVFSRELFISRFQELVEEAATAPRATAERRRSNLGVLAAVLKQKLGKVFVTRSAP